MRYFVMVSKGFTPQKLHAEYASDGKRLTDYSLGAFEKYLSAINRAVKKYGTIENAKAQYLKETRRTYVEIRPFIEWAPAGQRAKSDAKSSKRAETKKALIAVGFTAHQAEWAMDICKVR